MSDPSCHCGRPTHATLAPPVELATDDVSARLEGVGVWACDTGHRTLADPDLAARVHAAVGAQLPLARPRRLRRDDACLDCGARLDLPPRRTETPVVVDGGPTVVTLVPAVPMVRCPDCGREQLPADLDRPLHALVEALVAASTARDQPGPA